MTIGCDPAVSGDAKWSASINTSCPNGSVSLGSPKLILGDNTQPGLWPIIFDQGDCTCGQVITNFADHMTEAQLSAAIQAQLGLGFVDVSVEEFTDRPHVVGPRAGCEDCLIFYELHCTCLGSLEYGPLIPIETSWCGDTNFDGNYFCKPELMNIGSYRCVTTTPAP
jgi:hypothetical protein